MTTSHSDTLPVPLADQISREVALREAMVQPALLAMERRGAVVQIGGGKHVTIGCLNEMASHLGVSKTVEHLPPQTDPINGEDMAVCKVTVTRMDGVTAQAEACASLGEKSGGRARWSDWHAVKSMAETRAKVRALTDLFSPIIQQARDDISITPAEIMPHHQEGPNPASSGGGAPQPPDDGGLSPKQQRVADLYARMQAIGHSGREDYKADLKGQMADAELPITGSGMDKLTHKQLDHIEIIVREIEQLIEADNRPPGGAAVPDGYEPDEEPF